MTPAAKQRLTIAATLHRRGVRPSLDLVAELAAAGARVSPPPGRRRRSAVTTTCAVPRRPSARHAPTAGSRTLWRLFCAGLLLFIVSRLPAAFSPVSATPPPLPPRHEHRPEPLLRRDLDLLLDELIAELDAAPNIEARTVPWPVYTVDIGGGAVADREFDRITALKAKLERWINAQGVAVVWLSFCPVERHQNWVGIYEHTRIRMCPRPSEAELFDILLHEAGHLIQDKVFRDSFDQHEADAISWLVQRKLHLPVAFSTTEHMKYAFGTTYRSIHARRATILRGATILLEALGE